MFSGIVDHCGEVLKITRFQDSISLEISTRFENLSLGESIAVDGVCLTVTAIHPASFCCDLSSETLNLTHLKHLKEHQALNLERSLRLNDFVGGHFVNGHVDQSATLASIRQEGDYREFSITGIKPEFSVYLIQKGSISVNGVSLTINEVTDEGFKLMLIPHTLERTNLGYLKANDSVNLEFDIFSKTIFKQVSYLMRHQHEAQ